MSDIKDTLVERGSRYGEWANHAQISQDIKDAIIKGYHMRGDGMNWNDLPAYMRESIEMIAQKLGRVVNGDPYYEDSWVDIIGYTQLVLNELEKKNAS